MGLLEKAEKLSEQKDVRNAKIVKKITKTTQRKKVQSKKSSGKTKSTKGRKRKDTKDKKPNAKNTSVNQKMGKPAVKKGTSVTVKSVDLTAIKSKIKTPAKGKKITRVQAQIKAQRAPIEHIINSVKSSDSFNMASIKSEIEDSLNGKRRSISKNNSSFQKSKKNFIYTGIEGFDALLEKGIPKGAAVLVAGGAGSGKTIFGLQTLMHHAQAGKKCLMMSFEESEERLISHLEEFGWDPKTLIKKNKLLLKRFNPFEITRSVDALLMKSKGELLIDVKPIIFPQNFKPDFILVDSLTAIASAFTDKEDSYRIYIEQLFRFFEEIGATSFLITETAQVPTVFSTTGVEEFLADSVVVIYNIKRGNVRERAIEILKLRGAGHEHKIVAMDISSNGMEIYPDQEVFGGLEEN
jgi:KaiC/GvpD/RAD55 family RecA-like ATPase